MSEYYGEEETELDRLQYQIYALQDENIERKHEIKELEAKVAELTEELHRLKASK